MTTEQIEKLWGEDLFSVFGDHIDQEGWLTADWADIIEAEVPRFDKDYNENPEYRLTLSRMYNIDFEEGEEGLKIRPIQD